LRAEVARLRELAARTSAPKDLHAAGIAELLAGNSAKGVTLLERAVQAKPSDAAFRIDLGAAYMTQFIDRGDRSAAAAALDAFDNALARAPSMKEAWFNKAVLLERLNRPADALAAWTRYFELPDDSGWREEAMRRRDAVQREVDSR
jgi:Flp pilus assembly protein TadD